MTDTPRRPFLGSLSQGVVVAALRHRSGPSIGIVRLPPDTPWETTRRLTRTG